MTAIGAFHTRSTRAVPIRAVVTVIFGHGVSLPTALDGCLGFWFICLCFHRNDCGRNAGEVQGVALAFFGGMSNTGIFGGFFWGGAIHSKVTPLNHPPPRLVGSRPWPSHRVPGRGPGAYHHTYAYALYITGATWAIRRRRHIVRRKLTGVTTYQTITNDRPGLDNIRF